MTLEKILKNDRFPVAVDLIFVTNRNSESDKVIRAQAMLDLWLKEPIEKKKVLDFGCGEGHLVEEMNKRGSDALGYDIYKPIKNGKFTSNWDEVVKNGPYDLIIMYDTLDHSEQETPPELLIRANQVLSESGKIRVRCHPWCSRHGTHLFHQANKAYLHLLFSTKELERENLKGFKTVIVIHPLATYQTWFVRAGLSVIEKKVHRRDYEPMFATSPLRELLVANWKYSHLDPALRNGTGFPGYAIEQEFIDYTLTK